AYTAAGHVGIQRVPTVRVRNSNVLTIRGCQGLGNSYRTALYGVNRCSRWCCIVGTIVARVSKESHGLSVTSSWKRHVPSLTGGWSCPPAGYILRGGQNCSRLVLPLGISIRERGTLNGLGGGG